MFLLSPNCPKENKHGDEISSLKKMKSEIWKEAQRGQAWVFGTRSSPSVKHEIQSAFHFLSITETLLVCIYCFRIHDNVFVWGVKIHTTYYLNQLL